MTPRRDEEARICTAAKSADPVGGLTHGFYKYPARFSPTFARTLIEVFTRQGDLVFDPFMGGGTTLVESVATKRRSIGLDISALAHFVSKAKTTLYSDSETSTVGDWVFEVARSVRTDRRIVPGIDDARLRNLSLPHTWRVKQLLQNALAELERLPTAKQRLLARAVVLRVGQWALDCRSEVPSTTSFRLAFADIGAQIVGAAVDFRAGLTDSAGDPHRAICVRRSAVGCENDSRVQRLGVPALILTSPPYPGVHVVYHRWQILGRKETPAPFWIANVQDGDGASHYTFGDRREEALDRYFANALAAFRSLAAVAGPDTVVAQMVGFADSDRFLPRYLKMLRDAGFREVRLRSIDSPDRRVWRTVPNRKWYADARGATPSSSEVVLFHRLA